MYKYEELRSEIFTDEGQRGFLKARDLVNRLLDESGCFFMGSVIPKVGGDSWLAMAYVDRLVELGEIKEVKNDLGAGQYRILMRR